MNYRKFYKDYYGIDFGPEYDIHHIDQNRNNNDIKNLLLLPKRLHSQLHWVNNTLFAYFNNSKNFLQIMNNAHHCNYLSSTVEMWRVLCEEMPKWIRRKESEDSCKEGFRGWDGGFNYDMFRKKTK